MTHSLYEVIVIAGSIKHSVQAKKMSYYDFTKAHLQPSVQSQQSSFDLSQNSQPDMMVQHTSSSIPTNSYMSNMSQQYPQHLQQSMLPSVINYSNEDSGESTNNLQSNRKQSMFGADDEASSSASDTSRIPQSSTGPKRKRKPLVKGSDEYKRRRERNNEAVKKSRIKSKEKTCETQEKVNELAVENKNLLEKVSTLSREFELLKDLYQTHARTTNEQGEINLSTLLDPSDL